MKARILSAIVGVPLVILAFVLHRYFPMCLNIIASLASLICTIEVLTAKGLNKNKKISIPCALVSVLVPIVFYWDLQYLILFAFPSSQSLFITNGLKSSSAISFGRPHW